MKKLLTTLALSAILIAGCKKNTPDAPPPTVPLVTTAALTNTGNGNYTTGGSIVSNGGATVTQSGIVWSQVNPTPSLTDSVIESNTTSGAFSVNISGIDFGKTYYFRAFATNSIGTGYGDVVTLITSNDSVRFTYNGQSVTYGVIISTASGKKWLDRNLGAKRVATAYDDYQAYGDLFQWGRPADGHQLIRWTTSITGTSVNGMTTILATSDIPGHNSWIDATASSTADWRSDNNGNRWATIPQGSCPAGWHVPSRAEWLAEVSTTKGGTATFGGITDLNTGYSLLKLTVSGVRSGYGTNAGEIPTAGSAAPGKIGFYWSSTDRLNLSNYTDAREFEIGFLGALSQVQMSFQNKSLGMAVRCIKDN